MVQLTSTQIKEKAIAIGFDKVGIVPAEPLAAESDRLKKWLSKGYFADMLWMEREPEKRTDPRMLLPNARSMVVVALNYFTPYSVRANGFVPTLRSRAQGPSGFIGSRQRYRSGK